MARNIGILILLMGLGMLIVFGLADVIRPGGHPGFGADQVKGTLAGAVLLVIGVALARRSASSSGPKD